MSEQKGRETARDNDLFFTCSLIDYIARKTKNKRADVVNTLGVERIRKIYDLEMCIRDRFSSSFTFLTVRRYTV